MNNFDLKKYLAEGKLTEDSIKDLGMSSSVSKRRAGAELKQKLAGKRSDGMGKYTATIYGMNGSKRVELKSLNDLNKFSKFELDEGKSLKEGVWKIGNPDDIRDFIRKVGELQKDYWDVVGSDSVMDGLDNALKEAKILLDIKMGYVQPEEFDIEIN